MTRGELPALRAQLLAERRRFGDIVAEIGDLSRALAAREPSRVELTGAAGYLQNFYNSIENCLVRIAHAVDEAVPSGADWHRSLVDQLSAPIADLRPAFLDDTLAARLDEYRRFRHAFRHMYFFDLDWSRVRSLLDRAPALRDDFDAAVDRFFDVLARA